MLENLEPPIRVSTCRIRAIISELDETDVQIFVEAINDHKKWPHKTLESEIRKRGLKITERAIAQHRKQLCSCA